MVLAFSSRYHSVLYSELSVQQQEERFDGEGARENALSVKVDEMNLKYKSKGIVMEAEQYLLGRSQDDETISDRLSSKRISEYGHYCIRLLTVPQTSRSRERKYLQMYFVIDSRHPSTQFKLENRYPRTAFPAKRFKQCTHR